MEKRDILNLVLLLSILSFAGLLLVPFNSSLATPASSGDLIKIDGNSSVYYLGFDGKRYVFPNEKIYKTWYDNFSNAVTISQEEMASYGIGGNITYKPGVRLVKISTSPKVYAVSGYGISGYSNLHWITSEGLASELYGQNWASYVDDIPDIFFTDYAIADDIIVPGDYNKDSEIANATTPFTNSRPNQSDPVDKYCETDNDCKSLDGCDYGCWNIDYVPQKRLPGTACPAVEGPEQCICYQNECRDQQD